MLNQITEGSIQDFAVHPSRGPAVNPSMRDGLMPLAKLSLALCGVHGFSAPEWMGHVAAATVCKEAHKSALRPIQCLTAGAITAALSVIVCRRL